MRKTGFFILMMRFRRGFAAWAGRMFGIEHLGAEPDIITTGKSLARGLPLSRITRKAEIMDAPYMRGLGGTFGGNPVACRGVLAVIETIERENLLGQAKAHGKTLIERFKKMKAGHEIIGDIRGVAGMVAHHHFSRDLWKHYANLDAARDHRCQIRPGTRRPAAVSWGNFLIRFSGRLRKTRCWRQ